jgi:hypothetical protein
LSRSRSAIRFAAALIVILLAVAAGAILEWRWEPARTVLEGWRQGHRPWPDEGAPVDVPDGLELFILAGQSNMSGRGPLDQDSAQPAANVFVFGNDGRWHAGIEPVDNGRDQVDRVSFDVEVGVSPGVAFGERWSELNGGRAVGLIPCAMGGSSIADWQRSLDDRTLYGSMLKRCRAASLRGEIRGVLFFQGETDAFAGLAEKWGPSFAQFVADLRNDLDAPELPVVFAQLGGGSALNLPEWARLQERQAAISLPRCAMIRTSDLDLADGLHFTTPAYRTIGRRFAEAMAVVDGR